MNETIREALETRKTYLETAREKVINTVAAEIIKAGEKGRTTLEYNTSTNEKIPEVIEEALKNNTSWLVGLIRDEFELDERQVNCLVHPLENRSKILKLNWGRENAE